VEYCYFGQIFLKQLLTDDNIAGAVLNCYSTVSQHDLSRFIGNF